MNKRIILFSLTEGFNKGSNIQIINYTASFISARGLKR